MEASVASVPLFVSYITIILLLRLIGYKVHLLSKKIIYTVRMVVEEVSFVRLTNKL